MMQKHIILIVFTLLLSFGANAQLEVGFSSIDAPVPGGTVDVDVSVSNFEDIISLQYFILWDSLVLSYDSVFNVTDQLEQFSIGNIGTPETILNGEDGEMTVSWSHSSTNEFSLPDNTLLFTVRMNVVGSECDSTAITIGNIPPFQNIEVINADFDDIGATAVPLPFALPGTDCGSGGGGGGGGGGSTDIVLRSSNESGDNGENVCVSVIVDNFNDVQTAQGSMMWDPNVLSYTGTANNILPGNAFGEGEVNQGMLAFNWFDGSGVTPQNLPNGTTIFDVCFDIIGAPGSSSIIKFTDNPTSIVFSDSNDEELPFTTSTSTVSVNSDGGGGGGGGNEGDLILRFDDIIVNENSNICIPMVADNFTNIQTVQGGIMWDPNVLTYTNIDNSALPGLAEGNGGVAQGMLSFNWFDDSGITPVTLPDGGTVFEVCFDVIGAPGSFTDLKIVDQGNVFVEASDADGNLIDVTTDPGVVTVGGADLFTVSCANTSINAGSNGCIDILVSGFENIASAQFSMTWNDSQLTYTGVDNLNTSVNVQPGQFNQVENNKLRFSWFSSSGQGQTIPNGSTLFSVCFDAIPCPGMNNLTGNIQFVGDAQVPIEIGNGEGEPVAFSLPACSYTIECVPTNCTVDFGTALISPPICFGESNGSITVNPTVNCSEPITCTWHQGSETGPIIASNGCSLTNVTAGTYVLVVNVDAQDFSKEYVVDQGIFLDIDGNVFPVNCNSLGGVNTTITGGSGNYNCEWTHNGAIGCNIGGLEVGQYQLIVTDVINGCAQVENFDIVTDFDLQGTASISSANCDGGTITISLNQSGPFNYEWSHPEGTNSPTQTGLEPGIYSCTISTDSGNCTEVVSGMEINFEGVPATIEALTVNPVSCNGNDGSASFNIIGGCLPYDCEVVGPNGVLACDNLENLAPGNYSITVNDASSNGPISQPFTIEMAGNISIQTNVTPQTDTAPGAIATTVTGGVAPYTYTWSPQNAAGLIQGAENQNNLQSGIYSLTVTDSAGCTGVAENIVVPNQGEPMAPIISNQTTLDVLCGNSCEGEYNASITGQGPFVYAFTNTEGQVFEYTSLPIIDLCFGDYILVVTDVNGATATESVSIGGNSPIVVEAVITCEDEGEANGAISITTTGGAGGNNYQWSPIDDITTNPENLTAGTYQVIVSDVLDCTTSQIYTVEVCDRTDPPEGECGESSTVLTPNGDGVNDQLIVMCSQDYPNTFAIYDRWGRVVHEAIDYADGWDGTDLNGNIVTEGVYYWVMDSTFDNGDHRIFKGYVNVIRETK